MNLLFPFRPPSLRCRHQIQWTCERIRAACREDLSLLPVAFVYSAHLHQCGLVYVCLMLYFFWWGGGQVVSGCSTSTPGNKWMPATDVCLTGQGTGPRSCESFCALLWEAVCSFQVLLLRFVRWVGPPQVWADAPLAAVTPS